MVLTAVVFVLFDSKECRRKFYCLAVGDLIEKEECEIWNKMVMIVFKGGVEDKNKFFMVS